MRWLFLAVMLPVLPASGLTTDHRLATTPFFQRSRRRPSRSTMVWRPSPSRLLSGLPFLSAETLLYRGRGVYLCVTFVRLGWAPVRFDGRWDGGRTCVLLPLMGRLALRLCARVDGDGPANPVLVCLLVVPHSRTHCMWSFSTFGAFPHLEGRTGVHRPHCCCRSHALVLRDAITQRRETCQAAICVRYVREMKQENRSRGGTNHKRE